MLYFVTENAGKFRECQEILGQQLPPHLRLGQIEEDEKFQLRELALVPLHIMSLFAGAVGKLSCTTV